MADDHWINEGESQVAVEAYLLYRDIKDSYIAAHIVNNKVQHCQTKLSNTACTYCAVAFDNDFFYRQLQGIENRVLGDPLLVESPVPIRPFDPTEFGPR